MLTKEELLRLVTPDETAAQFLRRTAAEALPTGLPCVDRHAQLRPGQVLEIVGPTGSAKSELLAQVGRFWGRGGPSGGGLARARAARLAVAEHERATPRRPRGPPRRRSPPTTSPRAKGTTPARRPVRAAGRRAAGAPRPAPNTRARAAFRPNRGLARRAAALAARSGTPTSDMPRNCPRP
jgi:hypothetical protein